MDKDENTVGVTGEDTASDLTENTAADANRTEPAEKENLRDRPVRRRRGWITALIAVCAVIICCAVVLAVMYREFYPLVTTEMGYPLPDASSFVKSGAEAQYASDVSVIDVSAQGTYLVAVTSNGVSRKCVLAVRDTIAPTATGLELDITIDDELTPEKLIKDIADKGLVTVSWETKPAFGVAGDYDAAVLLKDEGGNKTTVHAAVHIRAVLDSLVYEAGDEHPTVRDFLLVERDNADFSAGIEAVKWDVPGKYPLTITVDEVEYPSEVEVKDTVAPKLEVCSLVAAPDEELDLNELVVSTEDETEVSLSFSNEPDVSAPGAYEVKVTATDLGGNETTETATVVVSQYVVELEARGYYLSTYEVTNATGVYVTGLRERFTPDSVGLFAVYATISSGEEVCVAVRVVDTVPPTGKAIELTGYVGYPREASEFVDSISDMTSVTASFLEEPDWEAPGKRDVTVVLTDEGGNTAEVVSSFESVADTEPPVIYNARDRYCYVDEPVAYFKEIFAEDNADPSPELTVDSSRVDIHKQGEYAVTYTAVDADGNKTVKTVTYSFIEQKVTDEELDALVEQVFSQIFYDDMTVPQQAYAIFNYVYTHVMYRDGSDKTDWKSEAYRGITTGAGDCFTSYSTEYLLLSHIDCELMSVERMNGATRHYWCLVNTGTGWYHFDACNAGPDHYKAFMKTNGELNFKSPYFWQYDHTLYPDIATKYYPIQPQQPEPEVEHTEETLVP